MATAVTSKTSPLTLQLWWLSLYQMLDTFPVLGTVSPSRQGCAITSVVPEPPENMAF